MLDRTDLTLDAMLSCPTQPICPIIPIFNFYFKTTDGEVAQQASEEASTPKGSKGSNSEAAKYGSLFTGSSESSSTLTPLSSREGKVEGTLTPLSFRRGNLQGSSNSRAMVVDRNPSLTARIVGGPSAIGGSTGRPNFGEEMPCVGIFNSQVDGEMYTSKSPFEAKPRNRKEAQASNYWPQYFDAEVEEMTNHQENGTWMLVPIGTLPSGAKILRTKWVYDDKKGMDGQIVRFKARLTAMGNFQREGVDYFDTYASVMRTKTLRVLLQLLNASSEHEMEHWDIKAAFINADLEEDIWIYQPDGHHQKGSEGMVCKLKKALYGLKQAGRAWQLLLKSILAVAGFTQLLKDDGAFVAHTPDGGWCVIGTHVDDLFPLYNQKGRVLRDRVFAELMKRVKVKNEGEAKWALKILIERDREKGILKISQGQFVREVLQRFGFVDSEGAPTPAFDQGPNAEMCEDDLPIDASEIAALLARYPVYEAVGCLWWLANISRPDIYFAVFQASQYVSKPSAKLWLWISRIFKYLRANPDRGLVYRRPVFEDAERFIPSSVPLLQGDVDASFADAPGKRSTLGQLYWFLGGVIDWKSKRSTRVLDSSTDAECASLVVFGKENAWLRDVLKELGIFAVNQPTFVQEDNTAAIALSGQGPTKRSRHFDIAFYKFKQQVEYKEMVLRFVKTNENPADFFTKALAKPKFDIFRDMIMGGDELQRYFA